MIRDGQTINPYMPGLQDACLSSVSVSALGGTASLAWVGRSDQCLPRAHSRFDPGPGGETTGGWKSITHQWRLSVMAGAASQTKSYYTWIQDWYETPASTPIPWDPTGDDLDSLSVAATCSLSLVRLGRKRTASPPANRQTMDFTDMATAHEWFADTYATVTVEADGISASGLLGVVAPSEPYAMGTNFVLSTAFVNNWFYRGATPYAAVSDLACFGITTDLTGLDLYSPGSGDAPDATYAPDWKRAAPLAGDCLRITNDGGIAFWRTAASYSGGSGAVRVGAPVTLNFKAAQPAP